MIDLLFLAHNRRAFTAKTLQMLELHTDWSKVGRMFIYDDNSTDGTRELLQNWITWTLNGFHPRYTPVFRSNAGARTAVTRADRPLELHFLPGTWGGPVSVMNHFIAAVRPELFAKIDSDTCVPAGWLDVCLRTLDAHPDLDLLGIEALNQPIVAYDPAEAVRGHNDARFIGGIGLMRGRPFYQKGPMHPNGAGGRFGFTAWQEQHPCKKGFLLPSLPTVLLDHLPIEPWASLSLDYCDRGWQRYWTPYTLESRADLWGWFEQLDKAN